MKRMMEYVWLDGHLPEPNLRSKVKVDDLVDGEDNVTTLYRSYPVWSFDGSSTQQATGDTSDCLLVPVKTYNNPFEGGDRLVLCEVYSSDGTPHESNTRHHLRPAEDWWFGFEQEYVLQGLNGKPLGFPNEGYPKPQGEFYCGTGPMNVMGREIANEHLSLCLKAGIDITGTNAEVMIGQWEYQCFGKGAHDAADDLWMSRYIMSRLTERFGVVVNWHPKPVAGDWNGSGMHTNFSNSEMRDEGGEQLFTDICEQLRETHGEHIAVYGSDNDQRLTGLHETQHIDTFSYGVSDRSASIRIPIGVVTDDWKGYLEDRRPASNADPYKVVERIMTTLDSPRPMQEPLPLAFYK